MVLHSLIDEVDWENELHWRTPTQHEPQVGNGYS